MDQLDYAIINVLMDKNAKYKLSAITIKEIVVIINFSNKTIHRRLKNLIDFGVVAKGIKASREHTYFLTTESEKIIKEALI